MNYRLATLGFALLSAHAAAAPPQPYSLQRLPLAFEINRGQIDARARYLARADGANVYLTESGAVLAVAEHRAATDPERTTPVPWLIDYLQQPRRENSASVEPLQALALRYDFVGANPHSRIEGVDPLPGHDNYLIGNDPKQWRTNIPTYARVRYHEVYPGIDVVYYGNQGKLEFDVEVAPGADLAQVRLHVDGADEIALNDAGDLRVRTALGDLVQHKAVVYQIVSGERREVIGNYALDTATREIAFDVPQYDRGLSLVLDPTLVWTEQVGGGGGDANYGVAADNSGNWYLTGFSDQNAINFPSTVGAYQTTNNGGSDAFVRKVSNDGTTVLYSTLIGGSGNDTSHGIGVDASGIAYIAGTTYSNNFPTHNGLQPTTPNGTSGAGFVTALNPAGSGLVYSTYLGGSSASVPYTYALGIAVDANGNAFVTGETTTNDLPTTATSFQPQPATTGNISAYVFAFDSTGSRVFGTYLVDDYLGFGGDHGAALALDDQDNVYVAGYTNSFYGGMIYNNVTATQIGPGGGSYDILVARLNHSGRWLDWVTHVGGSSIDKGTAIAVNGGHQVMVTGWSASSDLPPAFTNTDDWAWIGQLDETGTQLMDSTFVGAPGAATFPEAIVWDELIVAGSVQKPSALPATNPIAGLDCGAQCGGNSSYGGFLALLTTGPLTLQSLTRVLGATGFDTRFHALAQDPTSTNERTNAAGGSNGTFPGTSPGDTGQGATSVAVDINGKPVLQVSKYFVPSIAESGQKVCLYLKVTNPRAGTGDAITGVHFSDLLPACIYDLYTSNQERGDGTFKTNISSAGNITVDQVFGKQLDGGKTYTAIYCQLVVNTSGGDCDNTTSTISSDQATLPPVTARLHVRYVPSYAMAGPGSSVGGSGVTNGSNLAVQATAPATITNDLPVNQAINDVGIAGDGHNLGGGTWNVLTSVTNSGTGNSVSAPIEVIDPVTFSNSGGPFSLSGNVHLDNDASFDSAGTTNVSGSWTGTHGVNIFGPGTVNFSAPPSITGPFSVFGGVFVANTPLTQTVNILGTGTVRGCASCADIDVFPGGDFYPCTGTTPCTPSIASLTCSGGKVEFDCGINNSPCTSVNVSGAVASQCDEAVIHLQAQPGLGMTFSNLITGSSNTGCPADAYATPANVLVAPLCTGSSVSLTVQATDDIFHSRCGG